MLWTSERTSHSLAHNNLLLITWGSRANFAPLLYNLSLPQTRICKTSLILHQKLKWGRSIPLRLVSRLEPATCPSQKQLFMKEKLNGC